MSQPAASSSVKPGMLAASAIRELLSGKGVDDAFKSMMHERRKDLVNRSAPMQDSYSAWLAARLVQDAAMGRLFVSAGDRMALRITWDMGDNTYWYIGSIVITKPDGSQHVAGGPWVLWKHLGEDVTPEGPGDEFWVSEYAIPSVSEGDVVELNLYRLPRDSVDIVERLDPVAAIGKDAARLIVRLPVPVIVNTSPGVK
ncbi:MAG: hypothetical protein KF699_01835 [Phycisphaeraceae bacterium]|nr:hypothetical protein [Phycisphaeraceae bacterium]MBX3407887.1 hypothetical protein [Phycisphaeraceae bacterium]